MSAFNAKSAVRSNAKRNRPRLESSPNTRRRLFLEGLEDRRLLATVNVTLLAGDVLLSGDQAADLDDSVQIRLNGANYEFTGGAGTTIANPDALGTAIPGGFSFTNVAVAKIIVDLKQGSNEISLLTNIDPADNLNITGDAGATTSLTLPSSAATIVTLTSDDADGYDGTTNTSIQFTNLNALNAGTNAADELRTYSTQTDWTIDEGAGSTLKADTATLNFSGFERLTGSTEADDYVVTDPGAVAYTLVGGDGANSLDLSAIAGANVTLTTVDGGGAIGTETTKGITFSGIKTLTGDDASSLTGTNAASTWVIDDSSTNTYATDLSFSGFNSLTGGDGVDIFNVLNNTLLTYTLNGGNGIDAFNFGLAGSLDGIANGVTIDGGAADATLTLNDGADADANNYTNNDDKVGRDGGGTITYSAITDLTINAGAGKNKLTVMVAPAAKDTSTFNAAGDDDTLDLTALTNVSVSLTAANAAGGFDGTVTGVIDFASINAVLFNGAGSNDTITGLGEDATWTVNDDTGSSYASQGKTLSFSGAETLNGGSKIDTFNVENNKNTSPYSLNGGAGVDEFNFGLAGSLDGIMNGVTIDGGTDKGNLTLDDNLDGDANNYTINDNEVGRTGGGTITYSAITDLTINAGAGKNQLTISKAPTADGTKLFNAAGADDTLDVTALTASVSLTVESADGGFDGTATGLIDFTSLNQVNFQGNASLDTLTGINEDATWTVNDDSGSSYVSQGKTLNFTGADTLNGGSKIDTFNVQDNKNTLAYQLNGLDGVDAFNFGLAGSLDGIANGVTVDGGAASATLTLNDGADADANNYTINGNKVGRDGGGTVTYSAITDLTINAGAGKNKLTVMVAPTATVSNKFNAAGDDDTLDLTALTNAEVTVTADNGAGGFDGTVTNVIDFTSVDIVQLKAVASTDTITGLDEDATWTINDVTGSRYVSNSKTLFFSNADKLIGGSKIDTFNVENNKNTTAYTLIGNAGVDEFNFGDAGSLDGITNGVTVDGGTASGTLTLNDAADGDANNYTLTGTTVGRDGGGTITYSEITDLTVNAGAGANKFTVTAVPTATGVKTLNGNGGSDTLNLTLSPVTVNLTSKNVSGGFNGSVNGTITSFTSINAINASSAVGDTLNNNTGKDATWTISEPTSNTFVADGETLSFDDFETLNGGTAKDTFKVQNNTTTNPYILNGNKGSDTFLIGDTVNSLAAIASLKIDGGANAGDTDELILLDSAQTGTETYTLSPTSIAFEGKTITPSVSGFNVESIKLNSSTGVNTINITDGNYSDVVAGVNTEEATITLIHPANGKLSTLNISDVADTMDNTWSVTSTQTVRSAPAEKLTIDYSATALSSLQLDAGLGNDGVTITSTPATTTVNGNEGNDTINVNGINHATAANGNDGNDTINVATGDLDVLGGVLTANGGSELAAPTRTVVSGGTKNAATFSFTPTPTTGVKQGDTLNVFDQTQTSTTFYEVTGAKVTRTGAANPVNHSAFEMLNLSAGSDDSDIIIRMNGLPAVVTVDGGGGADNRLQIKGTAAADKITIGDLSADETNRSQFEVTSITRMWVEGAGGADTIHNRTAGVPGLLDGGNTKTTNTVAAGQEDTIVSDAASNATFSPVLLGNDGADYLHTTNNSLVGTTYLVGDYFINSSKAFRIQAVKAGTLFGQPGDIYATKHASIPLELRNQVLARRDTVAGSYSPFFANITADSIGNNLTVINWLRGRIPLTVTAAGIAAKIAQINFHVRQFVRTPGTAAVPPIGNQTYRPGGVASANPATWSINGGEATGEENGHVINTVMMTNPFEAADVNGDGRITAFDALIIINELNLKGPHALDTSIDGDFGILGGGEERKPIDFLDVNGDQAVSAMDALFVINKLNMGQTTYEIPEFNLFTESDDLENGSSEELIDDLAAGSLPNSLTDEGLLAILAADLARDQGL